MKRTIMNMTIHSKRIAIAGCILAVCALSNSCSHDPSENENIANKRYFDAWMYKNYPYAEASGLGVYIIDDQPGDGNVLESDEYYALVDYTVTDLEGTITGTTSITVAQQLGEFSNSYYYGPWFRILASYYTPAGMIDMMSGMSIGGTRTAVIPGWLNVSETYSTGDEYFKHCTGDDAIYTVTLVDKTDDIIGWQIDTLERFVAHNMDAVDSTGYGYYYKTLVEPTDTTTMPDDTTFYINYVGRLLNGHVFDTNIKDTAKVHAIYSASTTYTPQLITMSDTYTEITMGDDGDSIIEGFAKCLSNMRPYERGICAFYSSLGYGYSGSGSSIPSFAPLVFEIEVVDEPED